MTSVLKQSLAELSCSFLVDAAFYRYSQNLRSAKMLVASALTQTTFSSLLFYLSGQSGMAGSYFRGQLSPSTARTLSAFLFAVLSGNHAQSLLHETGHALSSRLFFQKADPKITLSPFTGGKTKHDSNTLSPLGQKIGKERSFWLIAAAGPGLSLFVSSMALTVGRMVQDRFNVLGSYLNAYGETDYYLHAFYALSAFFEPRATHDFTILSRCGISPLVYTVALAAIPSLILKRSFYGT